MNNALTFDLDYIRARLKGDSLAALAWFRENWRQKRLFRWGAAALGAFVLLLIASWFLLARGLPDAEGLVDYETPLPTVVRGIDGEIVHSYARERRVQLQYADFPSN